MIAWANVGVLGISSLLFLYFYVTSAGPAALERRIGKAAYARCTWYRLIASAFELVAVGTYVVYFFYPLPIALRRSFPWPRWVSTAIAILIAIPSGYLLWRGLKDAGEESLFVRKEHTMYGGIYEKVRHPQAMGELPFWWVIAFLLHSPFLALVSLIWVPIFVIICWAEERDLLIRYGESYAAYRERTGAVIPKRYWVRRASGAHGVPWALDILTPLLYSITVQFTPWRCYANPDDIHSSTREPSCALGQSDAEPRGCHR
jgi:protein-S-isoprenylcysteine O-methyltransferase Ste14